MPLSLTLEVCLGTKRTTASSSCSLHLCLLWSISICLFLLYTPISVLTMSNYFSWIALCPFSFLFSCSLPCSSPPFLLFLPLLCSSLPLPFHPFVMSPSAGVVAVPPQYVQHAVPTPRPTRLWDPPHIPSTFTFSFSSTGFLEVT